MEQGSPINALAERLRSSYRSSPDRARVKSMSPGSELTSPRHAGRDACRSLSPSRRARAGGSRGLFGVRARPRGPKTSTGGTISIGTKVSTMRTISTARPGDGLGIGTRSRRRWGISPTSRPGRVTRAAGLAVGATTARDGSGDQRPTLVRPAPIRPTAAVATRVPAAARTRTCATPPHRFAATLARWPSRVIGMTRRPRATCAVTRT